MNILITFLLTINALTINQQTVENYAINKMNEYLSPLTIEDCNSYKISTSDAKGISLQEIKMGDTVVVVFDIPTSKIYSNAVTTSENIVTFFKFKIPSISRPFNLLIKE